MFIIGILLATVVAVPCYWQMSSDNIFQMSETGLMATKIFAGLCLALGYGLIGYLDDYIKVVRKRNLGLTVRQKLILQFLVAAAYLAAIYLPAAPVPRIFLCGHRGPGPGLLAHCGDPNRGRGERGEFYRRHRRPQRLGDLFFAVFCMVISSYSLHVWPEHHVRRGGGRLPGISSVEFQPSQGVHGGYRLSVFRGRVCALTFGMDLPILLIPLGIIYWMEIGSVMLQVIYFKLTHGKRLFKMSPIHHHFELCGWNEVKICVVFSCITMIGGLASMLLVFFGV